MIQHLGPSGDSCLTGSTAARGGENKAPHGCILSSYPSKLILILPSYPHKSILICSLIHLNKHSSGCMASSSQTSAALRFVTFLSAIESCPIFSLFRVSEAWWGILKNLPPRPSSSTPTISEEVQSQNACCQHPRFPMRSSFCIGLWCTPAACHWCDNCSRMLSPCGHQHQHTVGGRQGNRPSLVSNWGSQQALVPPPGSATTQQNTLYLDSCN